MALPKPRSRLQKLAFRGLYVLFLVGLVELTCCVFLKIKRADPIPDGWAHNYARFRQYELNPRFRSHERTGGRRFHSADGFREDAVVPKKKPDGVFRVIAMGGSTLYGLGTDGTGLYPFRPSLTNEETIDFFLEKAVNDELGRLGLTRKVEIINAAVSGYHTFHHLIYLNEILYEYEPDLVIFLDGHNDFYFTKPRNHWRDASQVDAFTTTGLNDQTFLFTAQMNVRFLARYSNFFQTVEYLSRGRTGAIGTPQRGTASAEEASDPAFKESVRAIMLTTFLREYAQIRALGKHLGFEMLVFLQPELQLEDAAVLHEKDRALLEIRTKNTPPNTALAMSTIRGMLPEVMASIDVPLSDTATIASSATADRQLYVDYCHLTPDGSRTVAEKMTAPLVMTVTTMLKRAGAMP